VAANASRPVLPGQSHVRIGAIPGGDDEPPQLATEVKSFRSMALSAGTRLALRAARNSFIRRDGHRKHEILP
jgi:hypothetical protein